MVFPGARGLPNKFWMPRGGSMLRRVLRESKLRSIRLQLRVPAIPVKLVYLQQPLQLKVTFVPSGGRSCRTSDAVRRAR